MYISTNHWARQWLTKGDDRCRNYFVCNVEKDMKGDDRCRNYFVCDVEKEKKGMIVKFRFECEGINNLEKVSKWLWQIDLPFRVDVLPFSPLSVQTTFAFTGQTSAIGYKVMSYYTHRMEEEGLIKNTHLSERKGETMSRTPMTHNTPDELIKDVKFNGKATIVFWNDGMKTVVKCSDNDIYDKEKAIMEAMMKKSLGNPSRVRKFFKKWIKEED